MLNFSFCQNFKLKRRFFLVGITVLMSFLALTQANAQDGLVALNPERKPIHDVPFEKLTPIQAIEDSLAYLADSMYNSGMSEDRVAGSYAFIQTFKRMIKMKESFTYAFPKLKEKMSILTSPDNTFKIYTWEIIRSEIERRYYGAIQLSDMSFIPLVDVSDQIVRGAEDSTFQGTRWLGCLYYNILKKEIAGQPIYFLLGWNGNGLNSEKKIIEVFGFNSQGQSQFGAPLFNTIERGKRKRPMRFIFEYQKGSKVTLNYDKELQQIIMDHCESQIGDDAKRYTYIPDGTYDGLSWDGQSWLMQEDIIKAIDLKQGNAPVEKPIK
jgi:hypothetical protein